VQCNGSCIQINRQHKHIKQTQSGDNRQWADRLEDANKKLGANLQMSCKLDALLATLDPAALQAAGIHISIEVTSDTHAAGWLHARRGTGGGMRGEAEGMMVRYGS
jgi:hypothetical protein